MDRKGESSPADPRLSMRGQVPVCHQASSFASHKLVRRATKNTAESLSCLQQGCKVCGAESMCLEDIHSSEASSKEEEEGRHGCGISQAPWLPLP